MKLPKLTSFFLVFFFLASFLAQARRLQENYDYGKPPATSSDFPADFLLTLSLELPTSLSLQDSQSFFERFNGVVKYMLTLSSLRSKEFGRAAKPPPPSPKPSDPINPTIIPFSLSYGDFGRAAKSPPPSPKPSDPINPTIIPSSLSYGDFGRAAKSPPPPPKPSDPINPTIISAGEFGREEKSPPPPPETLNPDHPTITTSGYGRPARSPPPAPINPGNGGAQVISVADE